MTNLNFRVPFLALSALAAGCASDTHYATGLPDSISESKITVRINPNDFTRTSENTVSSLYLAFFSSAAGTETPVAFMKAEKTENAQDTYSVNLKLNPGEWPDIMVAFANIEDENAMRKALSPTSPSTITDLATGGCLAMSSSQFFRNDGSAVAYTSLSHENFSDGNPIDVILERVAAKVTFNIPAQGSLKEVASDGKRLSLSIDSWGITATDRASYTLKQLGSFSDLPSPSVAWQWNDPDNHTSHWAQSLNYALTSDEFPAYGADFSKAVTAHISYNNANNSPGTSILAHETTRKAELFETDNALPSIVLAGHYSIDGKESPSTIYRLNNRIYDEEEYWTAMANAQNVLYKKDANGVSKLSPGQLRTATADITPTKEIAGEDVANNLVSPQLADGINLPEYCNAEGNPYRADNADEINRILLKSCLLMEKYAEGRCVFSIPIRHQNPSETETGHFGLVRNHHYAITVKEISGIGAGVADPDLPIVSLPESSAGASYQIAVSISVAPWTEVNQEIEIKE